MTQLAVIEPEIKASADAQASYHPADLEVGRHKPNWIELGSGITFCGVCGRFPNGVLWDKAPLLPRLPGGGEAGYLRETGE